ncbi:helix-turn-helix domain-containing protein [Neobacillus niacini]|uniref:helix-turn-helix domain-containing protein n=1 Tax=Neobacillus niacini TaxID=86668 RepID=UPI0021CB2E10|nr:helix-turn-helix domain-containing protein [Neobacillus niacini]MCM3763485.1 helix-turn-helix domain-containing protein [Neobacillus niacini]
MSTLGERLRIAREKKGYTQTEVYRRTNINNKTLSRYENDGSEPDLETLQLLSQLYESDYEWLSTGKTSSFTNKDEIDIAKRMEQIRKDLTSEDGLLFNGEPMSEEAVESFLEAMEVAVRQTQRINKKYIPKKYRKDDNI